MDETNVKESLVRVFFLKWHFDQPADVLTVHRGADSYWCEGDWDNRFDAAINEAGQLWTHHGMYPSGSHSLSRQLASIPLGAWESQTTILDSLIHETVRIAQLYTAMRRNLGPDVTIDGKTITSGAYIAYPFSDVRLNQELTALFGYVGWGRRCSYDVENRHNRVTTTSVLGPKDDELLCKPVIIWLPRATVPTPVIPTPTSATSLSLLCEPLLRRCRFVNKRTDVLSGTPVISSDRSSMARGQKIEGSGSIEQGRVSAYNRISIGSMRIPRIAQVEYRRRRVIVFDIPFSIYSQVRRAALGLRIAVALICFVRFVETMLAESRPYKQATLR
ncbi:hypothetical protein BDR06DRAFT_1014863 [Suillus hirtellus]|nr:hypothetical protein BDR06DRAFT_1014863 [Suillus hirtellus]